MKNLIKKVPVPFSGLMLGTAATGNLLKNYSPELHTLFGLISFSAFLLIIAKVLLFPKSVFQDLKNSVLFSVSGTFLMGLFFLSTYAQPFLGPKAVFVWYFSLFLYICYIFSFSWQLVRNFKIEEVYTGYLIVYVGIIAASNTAPIFGLQWIGRLAFWFGFSLLFPILFLLIFRYIRFSKISPSLQPLFGIFAAPFALCLVGYFQSFEQKSNFMLAFLGFCSVIFYIFSLMKIKKIFTVEFYPSFSSYTFPFVNSAIALRMLVSYFQISGPLQFFNMFQIILAVFIVVYVMIRYTLYFFEIRIKGISKEQKYPS